jgi:hypothetical protein
MNTHTTRNARAKLAGTALVDELIRRLRAAGYIGPIVTAEGAVHPDVERFIASHRATARHAANVAPRISEATFLAQLRALNGPVDRDQGLPQAEPEPERRALPPADEQTVALRRRELFEAAVARDGLTLAPDLGRAWQEAERLAAN